MKTAGIDTCAAGYIAISLDAGQGGYWLLETEEQLYDFLEEYERIFINIPVGLQDDKDIRKCDKLLRDRLGPDYKDAVINPPVRRIILAPTYGEA
ncbi:MAG TPA: DUF429 domain-containing protein, partial [Balneolaceae bacterium]|nr:DUF429 domain-containing protein [Balneolaceae bacterium]